MKTRLSCLIVSSLLWSGLAACAFQPGEHVLVGSLNKSGTVIEEKGNLVKVHLDELGAAFPEVGAWFDKKLSKVSSAGGGPNTRTGANAGGAAPGGGGGGNGGGAVPGTGSGGNSGGGAPGIGGGDNLGKTKPQAPAGGNNGASAGSPPNGLYQCNKISGSSYIHLGTLEINGGNYRGFSNEGGFAPYSMTHGSITWTAGLTGVPDGWRLLSSKYVGPDYAGRPMIKIEYMSPRDALEVVDAVRE